MITALQTSASSGRRRPLLYGDYPYYRADAGHWAADLRNLAAAGIDIVTFYIPWRFHEVAPGTYDFAGTTDPQRDVTTLLELIADAELVALAKPGPFVHAEIQLGGLPDRVSPTCNATYAPVLNARGEPVLSQGMALPSLACPQYRAAVHHWLSAVGKRLLRPALWPRGPLVAVQIANEGLYSDAGQPIDAHDFAEPAMSAFATELARTNPDLAVSTVDHKPTDWSKDAKSAWGEWSGNALTRMYRELTADLDVQAPTLANIPLTPHNGPPGQLAGWFLRTAQFAETGLVEGYTSWVGNAARSRDVLAAHWFGVRTRRSDNLEENWGFTWNDDAYARPQTPLTHALLALALGSKSLSVYTACATSSWGPRIELDPEGLRGEGLNPLDYAAPYCPGAPLREAGGENSNAAGLRLLREFVRSTGEVLSRGRYSSDAVLVVSAALAQAEAWPQEGAPSVLRAAVDVGVGLMAEHQYRLDVITEATAGDPAADPETPWLVPVPSDCVDEGLLALVKQRRKAKGAVLLLTTSVSDRWAEVWDGTLVDRFETADDVLPHLPTPRYAAVGSDPAITLIHEDDYGRPVALFAFNPAPEAAVVRRNVAGEQAVLGLSPGGSACVLWDADQRTKAVLVVGAVDLEAADADYHSLSVSGMELRGNDARDVLLYRDEDQWKRLTLEEVGRT